MIAVLFGTYNAQHAANALLADDLRRAGVEVRACHEPLWEETRDKHAPYFSPAGLAWLGLRWIAAMTRLALQFGRAARGASWIVAGFNGQLDVLWARWLARGRGRILFAPLVTITETLVDDRRQYAEHSVMARLLGAIDRASLRAADLVVADTGAHADYLCERMAVPRERILVQYLGAEAAFGPRPSPGRGPRGPRLRVLGYGSYLPLHGYDVVAEAARLVSPREGIVFDLIGMGPERARVDALLEGLPHVTTEDWVPYDELPARIAAADVVLGIFGSGVKARMVVPNKVYQAAQMGRPIVTADTPAIREVFTVGESILAVEATASALADALRALAGDEPRRRRMGDSAREAVERVAGAAVRAARLAAALGLEAPTEGAG